MGKTAGFIQERLQSIINTRKIVTEVVFFRAYEVRENHLRNLLHRGVEALARALQNNRSLTTLDLGDNSIGNRGMEALAQVVEDNESLTTLSLQGSTMKNYDFQIIQNCQTQPVKREQTSPHRLIDIYD